LNYYFFFEKIHGCRISELESHDSGVFDFEEFVEGILEGSSYEAKHVSDHYPIFVKFY